jgi:hypothetical protein
MPWNASYQIIWKILITILVTSIILANFKNLQKTGCYMYRPHVGFMRPGKPISPITTLSNHTSPLQGSLLEGEWGSPRRRPDRAIARVQDFIPRARGRFDLVGTSRMVVIRETREAKRTTCWSGSSPTGCTSIQITATLSDMSDRLSLLSSHSMFCYIDGMD